MKKQFQSLTEKGRWLLATLTLIFTLGIGQMWGENIVSITDLGSQGNSDIKVSGNGGNVTLVAGTHCGIISGCTATFTNNKDEGEKSVFVKKKGGLKFGGNAYILNISLTSPLKLEPGDIISFDADPIAITKEACNDASHTPKSYFDADPKKAVGTTSNSYEVTPFDVIVGESSLNMSRNQGSSVTIKSLTITRTKYAVTFNNGGHGTAPSNGNFVTVKLSQMPNADGMENDYWVANVDVKVWTADGKVDKTAGTALYKDDIVIIPAATTLTAHWVSAASTYDITFNNGGHGTAPEAINDSKVTLAELSAEGYLHKGWVANKAVTVDETLVAAGTLIANGKTAFVSEATEFTAQWATVWTVTYYDGETSLGTEIVENGNAPAEYAAKQTKTLASFVSWYSDAQLNTPIADITALSITANTPIYGKWDKAYAESIDMEKFVIDNKKSGNWKAYLDAANIAYSADGLSLDSLDSSKGNNNYPYLGLKFNKNKTADLYVTGNLKAGKLMIVKVGNISSTHMDIDGVTQTTPAIVGGTDTEPACTYWYYNADKEFKLVKTNSGTASVLKAIVITDPYVVTYNANGGDPVAPATFTGTALTLPSAVNGTASFLGWFDAATGGNKIGEAGDSYIPSASIELFAHWESISTDARLASITFSSAAGTLEPAFDPEVVNYTYTMPYPTASIPTITGATSVNANAQTPIIGEAAAAWGDAQTIKGVAQSGDKKTYTITMQIKPKDGVSLVKIEPTSQTKGTQTGLYPNGDELTINLSSRMNLGGSGKYIGVKATENFQEGDVLHLDLNAKPNTTGSTQIILYAEKEATNEVWATGELASEAKDYYLTLPAAVNGHKELYIVRTDGNKWNGGPSVMEVTRAMNPMLTAMTIDGRTVTINEAAKTATVTIPYEADLAALTITKTIVWNAPATENSIVVNDGSAWTLGENTYKLTDKDGDATTYTITVARDVLKHTVSFNAHGGSAVASVEVVDGESLAAAPADPTKDDYIFQGWAETDGGAIVDVTSFTISADKEFHAVWVSDGAIKLIVSGALNTTDFYTGATMADSPVEIESVNYDYAILSNTASSPSGVNQLNKLIAYNAKTTKTKVLVDVYNSSTSGRNVYIKGVVEGSDEVVDLANIVLDNADKKHVKSQYYEFNNAANRTIYISVPSSANTVYFLQVKVIESGSPLKAFGEAGYSFNFNKGRLFGPSSANLEFEGMNIRLSSNYAAVNSTVAKIKSTNVHFDVAAPVTMTVTTNNAATYYVATSADGTTNETAKTGASEFDLTAGTWYINAGGSEVQLTNIAFAAPKCAEPVIDNEPVSNTNVTVGDNLTATVVAHATDGADLAYQWYDASDDSEVSGATEATLTTTTPGEYYVVITASKSGYDDRTVQSANATLGYRDNTIATLSALSYGGNAIALEADKYEYRVDLAEGTTDVPALAATATQASYGATAVPTDATEFDNYEAISTVLVTAEDGTTTQTYTVHFYVDHMLSQVNVTGTTTWNWINAAEGNVTIKVSSSTTPVKKDEEGLMANVRVDNNKPTNDATFNSQALLFYGENVRAKDGGRWYASVGHIKFTTTVAGMVEVEYSDNGTNNRRVKINNALSESSASKTDVKIFAAYMPAGEITIMGVNENDTEENKYVRISKIRFVETADAEPSLARDDEWLAPGELGTICIPQGAVAVGADIYELVGKEPQYGKIVFETVEHMKPGKPYLFQAKGDRIDFILTDETPATEPDNSKAMKGTFEQLYLTDLENVYYFADHALWSCVDLTQLDVPANRAYVKMDEVQELSNPNPAPGRRRVVLGVHGEQVVTGVENLNASEQPIKLLINGQIFILRGEKMYDATGRLVK